MPENVPGKKNREKTGNLTKVSGFFAGFDITFSVGVTGLAVSATDIGQTDVIECFEPPVNYYFSPQINGEQRNRICFPFIFLYQKLYCHSLFAGFLTDFCPHDPSVHCIDQIDCPHDGHQEIACNNPHNNCHHIHNDPKRPLFSVTHDH